VKFLDVYAGSLGLLRTREHAQESLDQMEAYLFLYAFKLNHYLAFVTFNNI
jgi:hypothetical protein